MSRLEVKFWGSRGSLPRNSPDHIKYGGNTSCVEIRHQNQTVIMDGGSGLSLLGEHLVEQHKTTGENADIHILFSHFHNDHICGVPFFAPLYEPGFRVHFHTVAEDAPHGFQPVLEQYMAAPLFPVEPDIFRAKVMFHQHRSEQAFELAGITINSCPMPHPGGAHAYRLSAAGQNVVYATDTVHDTATINRRLVGFIRRAGLLIYDCTFDDAEFSEVASQGHSTWQEGVRLCQAAEVRHLAIFHHAPYRTDTELDEIGKKAQILFEGAFVAADRQLFILGD